MSNLKHNKGQNFNKMKYLVLTLKTDLKEFESNLNKLLLNIPILQPVCFFLFII